MHDDLLQRVHRHGARLHRGIPRDLELAHHLDGAVRRLGNGRRLTRQHGPRGDLGIDGVRLARGASRAPVAPIHFHDPMPRSAHRPCQAGAIAAGAFDAKRFNPPVCLGPRDQRLVAARVSDETLDRADGSPSCRSPPRRGQCLCVSTPTITFRVSGGVVIRLVTGGLLGLRPAGWPGWADRTVTGRGDSRPLWGHGPSGQLAAVRVAGGR